MEPTEEDIEAKFKEMVIEWVKLDDKIRLLSDEIKDLKNEKKQYEEYILAIMEKLEEDTINLGNGQLKRNISQCKGSLKEEIIQEAIQELTKDPDKAYEMTQFIIQKRPLNEKISLKRTIQKNNSKK